MCCERVNFIFFVYLYDSLVYFLRDYLKTPTILLKDALIKGQIIPPIVIITKLERYTLQALLVRLKAV